MNIPLLLFNIIFYAIVISLYAQAKRDPSVSSGVGFALMLVLLLFPILQFYSMENESDQGSEPGR